MTSSAPTPVWDRKGGWRAAGPAVVVALALLALFQFQGNPVRGYIDTASLFYWWGYQWVNPDSEGEHAWLILGLTLWLLWRNLRACEPEGGSPQVAPASPMGAAVAALLAGLALHALGFVAQQTRICILAFLLCTWGVLRLGGGRRWGAAAMFPLGFMLFAIPVNVLDSIGFWLRVWVVDASGAIARGAGIGVLQSGTQLLAPDGSYNYDVAAACSGIRSLTALSALSLLTGYLNFSTTWRRALIFGLCFPLVYLGNVARIVAIIFAAAAGGPRWGDIAHEVMGYGVFAIVLGGILGAASLLRRLAPEPASPAAEPAPAPVPPAPDPRVAPQSRNLIGYTTAPAGTAAAADAGNLLGDTTPASAAVSPLESCNLIGDTKGESGAGSRADACNLIGDTRAAWAVAGLVVVLVAGEMAWLARVARAPGRGEAGVALAAEGGNPVELPAFLGTEWIGRRVEVSAVEREVLPADTGYSRKQYVAVGDPQQQVFLSIVLSGRDRSSIHRPELCLVGQGWTIRESARHIFKYPGPDGAAFPATLLRVRREVQGPRGKVVVPQLVAYWFVGAEGVEPSHLGRIWRDAVNRVWRGRADRWAYVLMQTDAGNNEAAALARMQAVLNDTLPVFAPRRATGQNP